jgi:hypothetical protein
MPSKNYVAKLVVGGGLALAALTGLGGGAALAQAYPPGYAPVPPPRQEVIPVPPDARYVWAPGHWVWNGRGYVWVRGIYVHRHPGWHHWVDGHWAPRGGVWVWLPGYWN